MDSTFYRRLIWNVFPVTFVVGVIGYTLLGDDGLISRNALKQKLYNTRARAELTASQNEVMRSQINALRADPDAVRRAAAEQLLLAEPESVIYRFTDED